MVFVFDLDDTLCATDEFSRQWIARFFVENGLPFRQVADRARYSEGYFDWTLDDAIAWYKKFGDEMMSNFPPKEGAREALQFLREQGHKIVIATARERNWHNDPEGVTLRWLEKNGLPYDEIYIGRADKEKICKDVNADVFVDDDLEIVGKVAQLFEGTKKLAFLPTTNFNRDKKAPKGAIRIEKISDIFGYVKV